MSSKRQRVPKKLRDGEQLSSVLFIPTDSEDVIEDLFLVHNVSFSQLSMFDRIVKIWKDVPNGAEMDLVDLFMQDYTHWKGDDEDFGRILSGAEVDRIRKYINNEEAFKQFLFIHFITHEVVCADDISQRRFSNLKIRFLSTIRGEEEDQSTPPNQP